jgi:hypothetical protein
MPRIVPLFVALLLAAPATSLADDGVIEINQAKVLAGGITPGDTPGFPATLTQPGSYRLTGNLDRTGVALSTTAIVINASDITLDLGGFTLLGPAVCSGTPVTGCTNTGTGDGILAVSDYENVTVRNGTVRGMPRSGVRVLGPSSIVERVRALSNGLHGMELSRGVVSGSVGSGNLQDGISASTSLVEGSIAIDNGSDGIDTALGLVTGCQAASNGAFGLETSNTRAGYGGNQFVCNNSGGLCTNGVQVSAATALEVAPNVCGTDLVCP